GRIKEKFLKKWLNKDVTLTRGALIAGSYIWRLFLVNILYSTSFFSTFSMIYTRIFFPVYEGIEMLIKQKFIVKD
ncbi:MAG: hypothetical protein ABRQ39_31155, partial [Candidatus Eremiobacterota bacterium]